MGGSGAGGHWGGGVKGVLWGHNPKQQVFKYLLVLHPHCRVFCVGGLGGGSRLTMISMLEPSCQWSVSGTGIA